MYDRPTSVILNRTSIALIIGYKSFHEFLRVSKKEHNTDTKRDRHRHRESETRKRQETETCEGWSRCADGGIVPNHMNSGKTNRHRKDVKAARN